MLCGCYISTDICAHSSTFLLYVSITVNNTEVIALLDLCFLRSLNVRRASQLYIKKTKSEKLQHDKPGVGINVRIMTAMANPCNIAADLEKYIVKEAPPTVYYIPNFIKEAEEECLLKQVYSSPKPKWTQLSGRRLQNWGGLPHPKGMVAEKLPDWLVKYTEKISLLGAFAGKTANHVLVNEYKPGEGIMPHEDGPLYHPTVTTITLASHTLLDFYRPVYQNQTEILQTEESRYMLSLLVQRQSLLILQDDMYKCYLHGIKGVYEDILSEHVVNLSSAGAQVGDTLSRSTRVSLTIRHVPKVIRANLFLGKK